MKPFVLHVEAREELADAAAYYENESAGLGVDLVREFETALGAIRSTPDAFPLIAPGVRRKSLRRFPYGVLYEIESDRIFILAFMHNKRRPDYWTYRLE